MDFSGRRSPLFVSLGPGATTRRRTSSDDGGTTQLERFLGTRLHGFTTIVRVERGTGVLVTAAGRFRISSGEIAVLPPGSVGYAFDGGRRVDVLAMPVRSDSGMIVRAADIPTDLFERPDEVVIEVLRAAPIVTHIACSVYERSAMRALEKLDARPSSARLTPVAHELGYTSDGLSSLLVRETGTGFAGWRDALAMAHVRAALGTPKPIVRIARELDLEPSYLHRRFARSHGVSPSRWRQTPVKLPQPALAHDWDSIARYFRGSAP